jgi:hypothetical protein
MLVGEPRTRYYVYPSCCIFRYSFDDLRSVLADPFGHSALGQSVNYYRCLDYPLDIQPFDMLGSGHGGGIIVAHAAVEPDDRWLPACVLRSIASVGLPSGMVMFRASPARSSFPAHVSVLEPQSDPFAEYPTCDGRRFRWCSTTPENVDCCGDDVYWVLEPGPMRSATRLLESLREVAMDFQVQLDWLPDPPDSLKKETSGWFKDASLRQEWCRVSSVSQGVGLNFAVTVFCALHVRNLPIGSRLRAVHLVASIEGRPNVRKVFWKR